MKFALPTLQYKEQALAYIQEFHDHGSEIHGSGGLDVCLKDSSYEVFLAKVQRDLDIANPQEGRVSSYTYFYTREDDGRIVGMINIRLSLNDFLRKEGGHIGYSIRPTERRKGYGTRMLRETLAFCRTIGMHDFLITCDRENLGSAGIIKNNGGILEEEFYSETFQQTILRYRIP